MQVNADLPCELQIRTLLQHAYSELTHDAIYKPNVQADPKVKRAAAKSMALIEATGDYFTEVRTSLEAALGPSRAATEIINRTYTKAIGSKPENSSITSLIIDRYYKQLSSDFEKQLSDFLEEKPYVIERIKERSPFESLYRQSAILLLYFAIKKCPAGAVDGSPLGADELAPLYSDLGERLSETVR